ncbi:hypothetical protein OAK35_02760 [Crocinitomicaceae bacterium]|nr:hypothetical protein [Crocinitomicaceae bacterium]
MLKLCIAITLCISTISFGQNHEENFTSVNTVQGAVEYAKGFREVFTGIVHFEKDVFFFDDIDTSKLDSYVGTMHNTIGKRTKLIDDSMFNIVNVQVITLDLTKIAPETAEVLIGQMKKLLDRGDSYWDVKKRFSHTSAKWSSSPQVVGDVTESYAISEEQMIKGAYYQWERTGESIGFVVVDKAPHLVPGYYTLSYRSRTSNF